MRRYLDAAAELLAPVLLVAIVGLVCSQSSSVANSIEFRTVLVYVAISGAKLQRLQRRLGELVEQARARGE